MGMTYGEVVSYYLGALGISQSMKKAPSAREGACYARRYDGHGGGRPRAAPIAYLSLS